MWVTIVLKMFEFRLFSRIIKPNIDKANAHFMLILKKKNYGAELIVFALFGFVAKWSPKNAKSLKYGKKYFFKIGEYWRFAFYLALIGDSPIIHLLNQN